MTVIVFITFVDSTTLLYHLHLSLCRHWSLPLQLLLYHLHLSLCRHWSLPLKLVLYHLYLSLCRHWSLPLQLLLYHLYLSLLILPEWTQDIQTKYRVEKSQPTPPEIRTRVLVQSPVLENGGYVLKSQSWSTFELKLERADQHVPSKH